MALPHMASSGPYPGFFTQAFTEEPTTTASSSYYDKGPAMTAPQSCIRPYTLPSNMKSPLPGQASYFAPLPSDGALNHSSLSAASIMPSLPSSDLPSPLITTMPQTPATFRRSSSFVPSTAYPTQMTFQTTGPQPPMYQSPSAVSAMEFESSQMLPFPSTSNIIPTQASAAPSCLKTPFSPMNQTYPTTQTTTSTVMTPMPPPTPPSSFRQTTSQILPLTPRSQISTPSPMRSPSAFTPTPNRAGSPAIASNSPFAPLRRLQSSKISSSSHRKGDAHALPGSSGPKIAPYMTHEKYSAGVKQMLKYQGAMLQEILFRESASLKMPDPAIWTKRVWERWIEEHEKEIQRICPVAYPKFPRLDPSARDSKSVVRIMDRHLRMITIEVGLKYRGSPAARDNLQQVHSWNIHLSFLDRQMKCYKALLQRLRDAADRQRPKQDRHDVTGINGPHKTSSVSASLTKDADATDSHSPSNVANDGKSVERSMAPNNVVTERQPDKSQVTGGLSEATSEAQSPVGKDRKIADHTKPAVDAQSTVDKDRQNAGPTKPTVDAQTTVDKSRQITGHTKPAVDPRPPRPQFICPSDLPIRPITSEHLEFKEDGAYGPKLKRKWPFKETSMEPQRPVYLTESDTDLPRLMKRLRR